jgi:hypothetical protein
VHAAARTGSLPDNSSHAFSPADFDEIIALADDVGHAGVFIQLFAELVEVGNLQLAACLMLPLSASS